jgi:hypothetical protein
VIKFLVRLSSWPGDSLSGFHFRENVSQMKYREVNAEIREFLQGKDVPRVKVIRDITS